MSSRITFTGASTGMRTRVPEPASLQQTSSRPLRRSNLAQVVEEIQDEDDSVSPGFRRRKQGGDHGKPLAIGMHIEQEGVGRGCELVVGPASRLRGSELIP